MANQPTVYGDPLGTAVIRSRNDDFRVEECLDIPFSETGEHLWLLLEKRGITTDQAIQQLARAADVAPKDIGFSGLKDRWAVTRQWVSLGLGSAAEPQPARWENEFLRIIRSHRHGRKLRRGTHRANRFRLTLRNVDCRTADLHARLDLIARRGVPNYFGPQRFGRRQDNVSSALAMFAGRRVSRRLRGIYLSAARAFLFNAILAQRVAGSTWDRRISGDAFNLAGSASVFGDDGSPDLAERLASLDIHPTGPLWGRGDALVCEQALALETAVVDQWSPLRDGLEHVAAMARRSLRMSVTELTHVLEGDVLTLEFTLPRGSFATSVLRELFDIDDAGGAVSG